MYVRTRDIKLFVEQAGEGSPTVVFEAGMGEDHQTWRDVQPIIARLTHTFSYDRAGLGQSEKSNLPRSAVQFALELHTLLHAADLPGPFILVGHSLGGYIITVFAHQFAKETAGLVFVDLAFDEQRLKEAVSVEEWAARQRALEKYVPPMQPGQQLEADMLGESSRQAGEARPLPNVPAVILSGTLINSNFPGSGVERDVKLQTHREWAAALTQSEHVMVPEARHYLQNETPTVVIDAIKRIISRVRNSLDRRDPDRL